MPEHHQPHPCCCFSGSVALVADEGHLEWHLLLLQMEGFGDQ